jgi:ArsR family transcriptional regulator
MLQPAVPPAERFQLNDEAFELIAGFFKVLADPVRLRLLHALYEGELTVMQLMAATGANQANVSKHLKVLHDAGLVTRRKQGTNAWYRIGDAAVFNLCRIVCDRQEAYLVSKAAAFREDAS